MCLECLVETMSSVVSRITGKNYEIKLISLVPEDSKRTFSEVERLNIRLASTEVKLISAEIKSLRSLFCKDVNHTQFQRIKLKMQEWYSTSLKDLELVAVTADFEYIEVLLY